MRLIGQVSAAFQFYQQSSVFIQSIEPGWLSLSQNYQLRIAVANLFGTMSPGGSSVTVQGHKCACTTSSEGSGSNGYLVCNTPNLFSNSTSAVVTVAVGSTLFEQVLPVIQTEPRIFAISLYFQDQINASTVAYVISTLSLSTFSKTLISQGPGFTQQMLPSKIVTSFQNLFVFQIVEPAEVFFSAQDFIFTLRVNARSSCPPSYPHSCTVFTSQSVTVTNITILASTIDILLAYGIISVPNCPTVFCGLGGMGLFLDATFHTKTGRIAEQSAIITVLPAYSREAVSVTPSIVPFGTDRLMCDLVDTNGKSYLCNVEKILQEESGNYLNALLQFGSLPLGQISGRIFSGVSDPRRSFTLTIFVMVSCIEPKGPGYVDWISFSQGPSNGGTAAQAKLIGFPLMNSTSDVRYVFS